MKTLLGLVFSITLFAQSPYTIAALPDMQYQASPLYCPTNGSWTNGDGYLSTMQWIVDNATTWNTKSVVSLGDVVDSGQFTGGSGCSLGVQDTLATAGYNLLIAAHMPFNQQIGNHD